MQFCIIQIDSLLGDFKVCLILLYMEKVTPLEDSVTGGGLSLGDSRGHIVQAWILALSFINSVTLLR